MLRASLRLEGDVRNRLVCLMLWALMPAAAAADESPVVYQIYTKDLPTTMTI
jgi:hypothetical protein